jgi:RimJ/RimL family protein N-acetyltransferase
VRGAALRLWRRIFQHRNHVFVFEGPPPQPPGPPDLHIVRIASLAEFPEELRTQYIAVHSTRTLESLQWEFDRGAVLWVGVIAGAMATSSMTRRGAHFLRWFVPLQDADMVIFRNQTLPEFRGRRLNPALMHAVMAAELPSGGRAYIDCKVHNHASIRSIEHTGFRRIATLPPLKIAGQFRFDAEPPATRAPAPR